jgi:hypothetical protein
MVAPVGFRLRGSKSRLNSVLWKSGAFSAAFRLRIGWRGHLYLVSRHEIDFSPASNYIHPAFEEVRASSSP